MACPGGGHIFCKFCIIENLVSQKKLKEVELRRFERDAAEQQRVTKEAEEKEALKKVEKFERVEMTIPYA